MVDAVVAPGDHPDAEGDRVDAAHARELEALVDDALGRDARRAQGHVVAHEVAQQSGAARDKARQTAGVARAEFDAAARVVIEVQQGAAPAECGKVAAPALPRRCRHIHGQHAGVADADRRGLRTAVHGRRLVDLMIVITVGTPHAVTL